MTDNRLPDLETFVTLFCILIFAASAAWVVKQIIED